ncbi:MAG: dienelactone hydrolase family protein [Candidatus Obscuribacter sp.]|nr:dienelactone hydrolase family protein [Candidatus Melainabacteria bacterium]MDX1987027.1 dienelactone hydrolase family protein [Candidatus Obscuribacter sp.]
MHTQYQDYKDGDLTCEAYIAIDENKKDKRPAVLVSHAWGGQSDFERGKAEKLAKLGYVGIAIDLYGKGNRGTSMEENAKLMQPFMDDRAMLRKRILAALSFAKSLPQVDADKIGAIGFCFGGLCVLDLARSAAAGVQGVVSFHGLFHAPNIGEQKPITAKALILHGYDDPMATPEQMVALAAEMTKASADWQIHAYGNTVHAFTNPEANMPENGIVYCEKADKRSWQAMVNFLAEALA